MEPTFLRVVTGVRSAPGTAVDTFRPDDCGLVAGDGAPPVYVLANADARRYLGVGANCTLGSQALSRTCDAALIRPNDSMPCKRETREVTARRRPNGLS